MAALVVHLSPAVIPVWLWVVCAAALLSIPATEWLRRDPQRVRFTLAFCVAMALGTGIAFAAYPPPGWTADCCDWLLAYGICWPIGWWGC